MLDYDAIAQAVAATRPASALDWGCGFGPLTARLVDLGIDTTAIDHHPSVDELRTEPLAHYPGLERIMSPDPVRLPFDDGEFDAIVSCGTLEHVEQPEASLRELHRVLRPGGLLHVHKLPYARSWLEWVAKRVGLYYHGKYPNDRIYDPRSAREIVERAGFAVRDLRRVNVLPLTVPLRGRTARAWWQANRALSGPLRFVATNVELVAQRR